MVDYTGKLNHHEDYLKILNVLERKSSYMEIVLIGGEESNGFIESFQNDILLQKKVSKWWGTKTSAKNCLYRIKTSRQLFDYLRKFETFCKYSRSGSGECSEITDFGYDDVAFFDSEKIPLLFTTTHEGYISVREDLAN